MPDRLPTADVVEPPNSRIIVPSPRPAHHLPRQLSSAPPRSPSSTAVTDGPQTLSDAVAPREPAALTLGDLYAPRSFAGRTATATFFRGWGRYAYHLRFDTPTRVISMVGGAGFDDRGDAVDSIVGAARWVRSSGSCHGPPALNGEAVDVRLPMVDVGGALG